ncbi:uncharacterized protein LOC117780746 isoform X2 [Drosophila innubila]|uniref:uncharacterized protein LOC117780746 isoform X2 n=1 Tax=Drosophila innubila TaxID=198719 RepID=UPI00148DDB80|nr:uncharacterized protein LOC117780746 isoform X2 [Drosophila innubila]
MAAKNKINSLNLFGFAKRFPKGYSPQRNVTSCSQLRKRPQTNEPDYSKFLSKESAIYMVREAKALNRKSCKERRLENEQAEAQLRKCNNILKEHYLQRREQGQKVLNGRFAQLEELPTISKKLKAIMALNATTKPIETTSLDDLKQCHAFECKRYPIDYKPQNGGRLNRWRMKVPYKRAQNLIDKDSAEASTSSSSAKRVRKVQPPEIPRPKDVQTWESIQPDKLLSSNQTKNKFKNMWQIGARYIPRLN